MNEERGDKQKMLWMLGCSHESTPLAIREQIAAKKEYLPRFFEALKSLPGLEECTLLSTCNRLELYAVSQKAGVEMLKKDFLGLYCDIHQVDSNLLNEHSHRFDHRAVVQHLFETVCGLKSQILGENEILGQVKRAFSLAQEVSWAGPIFHRLFPRAFQYGKWARTHTQINKGGTSIGSVAADLALRIFEDLSAAQMLVIGSGEVGQDVIQRFKLKGAKQITIASPTLMKAQAAASKYEGRVLPYEHLGSQLGNFDIIVGCCQSEGKIFTDEIFQAAHKHTPSQPTFLIDLGLPRNFPETLNLLPNTYLYNLDDLSNIAQENKSLRKVAQHQCLYMAKEKSLHFWEAIQRFL